MKKKKLIAIVGPTASGKTGLGVFLARKYNGEIVSADSRQVYRGLDIGTGKEGTQTSNIKHQTSKIEVKNQELEELVKNIRWIDGIPQWMIDVAEPEERFTLFDYLEQARSIIDDIFARGKTPIIVGGTGLYVSALTEGYSLNKSEIRNPKPETNSKSKIQKYSRDELEQMPLKKLQEIISRLKTLDSDLDLSNPRRLIRAIERAQSGDEMTKVKPDFQSLILAIDVPREELYQRIDQRADERFKAGMLEETQQLMDKGVDFWWLLTLGLDYRIMTTFLLSLAKEESLVLSLESTRAHNSKEFREMVERFKFAEHNYARRQLTWWRQRPGTVWISDKDQAIKEAEKFLG